MNACEVYTVDKISDCQSESPRFKPEAGEELNFGQPSFATLSVDRDINILEEPTHLSILRL